MEPNSSLSRIFNRLLPILKIIFSRENMMALFLALILTAIYIATAADSPIWIYQGY
jgi:hypothetical protein